ncbi:hypothetical protein ABZ926_36360 [Streptomyces litmocidini]|uniref:Uncharacterized protein n=1 Tax=Streptomyces litmocidini TaxID=67318 RepID=A0ABW7TXC1_9ACTN|nr:hypothetical protein [Streptomyces sp. PanSC19]
MTDLLLNEGGTAARIEGLRREGTAAVERAGAVERTGGGVIVD